MKKSIYSICFLLFTLLNFNVAFAIEDYTSIKETNAELLDNITSPEIDEINTPLGGNVIITQPIPMGNYCRSSTVVVNFNTEGTFPAPNNFIAQLSNAVGDFTTPVNIGSLNLSGTNVSGSIFAVLPGAFTSGTGYRIRVISTNPSTIGTDNGSDITLQLLIAPPIPSVNVNGPLQFCFASASTFLTSSTSVNNLWFPGGVNNQPFLGVVSSGNYYTQVTGSNGCVTSSVPVSITVNTPIFSLLAYLDENGIIVTDENPVVTICEGDSLPIVILVDGGVAPYQLIYSSDGGVEDVFFIDAPSDSTVIYVKDPGVYTLIGLVDAFPTNCGITLGGSSGAVTVVNTPRPDISFQYEPYCGSFSEEPTFSENWIPGGTFAFETDPGDGASVDASTGVISGSVSEATYSIVYTVQGPNCEVRDTSTVTVEPSDIVDFSYINFCPGLDEITPILIEGFAEGGVFSFETEPGDGATINPNTGVVTNAVSGTTYIISYTSPVGECQNTGTATIEGLETPEISGTVENALCNNAIGEVNITITGGEEPYTFSWSNDQTSQNIAGLEAGSYSVTVTDANGCEASNSFTVENDNEPEIELSVVNATCGEDNGSISVNIVDETGTPEFTFLWSANTGNATSSVVENLAPGIYSVTVTDGAGCEVSSSATIIIEDAPELSNILITPSSCTEPSGAISFEITGAEPISFLWTDGETTQNISDKNAGTYEVTITDGNDCELTQAFTIEFENPVVLTITEVSQPTCFDVTSGSIQTNTTGGTPEFTYLWNDESNSTTPNLSGLGGGSYKLVVTDAAGCSDSIETIINNIVPLVVEDTLVNPTCGNEDGSITIEISGASGAYSFLWNDANTNQNRTGLAVGEYSVVITDSADATCTLTLEFNLQFEDIPTLAFTSTNTTCDVDTGSATVTVIGGSGNYEILWTPGDLTTESITGLAAGSYNVTVTDENGCEASGSVTITNIDFPVVTAVFANTTCGNNNGIIDLTVTSGTQPFSFEWSNGATTEDLFSLAPGEYSYILTDAKNCIVEGEFSINPSIAIESELEITPSICGNSAGAVSLILTNTTGVVNYAWTKDGSPFASTQNISNLEGGTYIITAFDAAGCIIIDTADVINTDQPIIISEVTGATCGLSDGAITITVENGSGNFTILWENEETTATIENLAVGCYNVEIFDENGCEASSSICVDNENAPVLSFEVTQPTCGQESGRIELIIEGGTTPFSIEWNIPGNGLIQENLGPGSYSVTVIDSVSCEVSGEVELFDIGSEIIVLADVVKASCGLDDGSISLTITGGVEPYSIEWTQLPGFTGTSIDSISAGIYEVIISDAAGCVITENIILENDVDFDITAVVTEATCGLNDGAIDITITGGTGFYLVSWYVVGETDPFDFEEDIDSLATGVYRIVIFEKDGCSDSLDVVVGNVVDFEVNAEIENPSCGSNNGSITLTVEGGTGPFEFLWNDENETTTQNLENVPGGTYTVTVTDANGCVDIKIYTIEDGPGNVEVALSGIDASCGLCNGSINLEIIEGELPFTFNWSNGATTQNLTNVCTGEYIVNVIDANGCEASDTITIGGTEALTLSSTQENTLCNLAEGSATVVVETGTAPFQFLWNNDNADTTATIENLFAGSYTVTVTDSNNCEASLTVNIINENEPILTVVAVNPSCEDENSGSIDISFENAIEPVVVTFNGDTITEFQITGLSAGLYEIILTDSSGCVVSETVNLVNQDAPFADITLSQDSICLGESAELTITLTGDAPFTLTYFNGIATITVTDIQTNTLQFTVNPTDNTTYSLISLISEANPGCAGYFINDEVILTVSPLPAQPTISAEGDLSICEGESVTLTSDITENIVWSPNGETTAQIITTSTGTYFVTVTNEFGCTAVSNSIDIINIPTPDVSAGEDVTICFGQTTQLQATGAEDYVWSPSIGLTGTIISNPIASPPVTTTYTVTGTNACGSDADTITINVLPVIQPELEDVYQICEDAPFTFSVPFVEGATYEWGPSSIIIGSSNTSSVVVSSSVDTQVFVTITNTNACISSDTANISIIPAPTAPVILAESDTIFCEGQSVVLTSNIGEGVTWSNGIINVLSILVTESGTYTVTVSDGTCEATSNAIVVSVLPRPDAVINPAGPITLCEGETIELTADTATTYKWTAPDATVSTTQNITASQAGVYTLVVTNEAGCESNPVTVSVSVVDNPATPTITLDGPSDICDGDIVNLTTNATGNFTWFINGTNSNINSPTVSTNVAGTYQVTVTNAAGCSATSELVTITVKPNLPPTITSSSEPIICDGEEINITLTASPGFTSYFWSPDSLTTASIVVTQAGIYTVTGTNQSGCQASASIEIIQSPPINAEISSPTNQSGYNISTIGGSDGIINTTVSGGIPDYTYSWSDNPTILTPDRSNLSEGTYTVVITDAVGCSVELTITLTAPSQLVLPNGFTPNGDGFNDRFVIKGLEGYTNNTLTVFNRWGNIVYQQNGYNNDWNGVSNNGKDVPDGTYFIILEVQGFETLNGYLDIRR